MPKTGIAPKRPIVIYLDTQDYINLFQERSGGSNSDTLQSVIKHRDNGDVVIGYSWVTIIEFITRPTDRFREERVRRGQLIKDICGQNAFPFFTELKDGAQFPNGGRWINLGQHGAKSATTYLAEMARQVIDESGKKRGLNRHQRRSLKSPRVLRQLLNNNNWGERAEDFEGLPVSQEMIESGIFQRFLKGECSEKELDEQMNMWVCDPVEYSRLIYDYADMPNVLDQHFGDNLDKMEQTMRVLQERLKQIDEIQESIRETRQALIEVGLDRRTARQLTKSQKLPEFDSKDVEKQLELRLGDGRAGHFVHYLRKATTKNYKFKRSDFMDIMQMCYAVDCDLFRCDKAMAAMFQDFDSFDGKLVDRFSDLPSRIEEILARQRSS